MKSLNRTLLVGAAALALSAAAASAEVVCNAEGDCWRVKEHRNYEPSLKLRIMPDNWKWKEGENYRWREPGHGHGYWHNGAWIEIK